LLALTLIAGCDEPTSGTTEETPVDVRNHVIIVTAASPREIVATAGSDVSTLPSVRVYDNTASRLVVGATVQFRLGSPDGQTRIVTVTTSADGIATLPSWHVGNDLGRYTAVAQLDSDHSVEFVLYVRGRVVEIYDLVRTDGPAPFSYATEGHFVLFEDGTYSHVYNVPADDNSVFSNVAGPFVRRAGGVIDFYLYPSAKNEFYAQHDYLFASATPVGSELRVTFTDTIDYDAEIYTRR
jgi:hypothetical protein